MAYTRDERTSVLIVQTVNGITVSVFEITGNALCDMEDAVDAAQAAMLAKGYVVIVHPKTVYDQLPGFMKEHL